MPIIGCESYKCKPLTHTHAHTYTDTHTERDLCKIIFLFCFTFSILFGLLLLYRGCFVTCRRIEKFEYINGTHTPNVRTIVVYHILVYSIYKKFSIKRMKQKPIKTGKYVIIRNKTEENI